MLWHLMLGQNLFTTCSVTWACLSRIWSWGVSADRVRVRVQEKGSVVTEKQLKH